MFQFFLKSLKGSTMKPRSLMSEAYGSCRQGLETRLVTFKDVQWSQCNTLGSVQDINTIFDVSLE